MTFIKCSVGSLWRSEIEQQQTYPTERIIKAWEASPAFHREKNNETVIVLAAILPLHLIFNVQDYPSGEKRADEDGHCKRCLYSAGAGQQTGASRRQYQRLRQLLLKGWNSESEILIDAMRCELRVNTTQEMKGSIKIECRSQL
jgi:hypothetical protein